MKKTTYILKHIREGEVLRHKELLTDSLALTGSHNSDEKTCMQAKTRTYMQTYL